MAAPLGISLSDKFKSETPVELIQKPQLSTQEPKVQIVETQANMFGKKPAAATATTQDDNIFS